MKAKINLGTGEGRREDWRTPRWLFERLDAEFHFTLDVCAQAHNAQCQDYINPATDALRDDVSWGARGFFFMNPPFGQKNLPQWMAKAAMTCASGTGGVCLVPVRADAYWWHEFAVPYEVRFIRSRVAFDDGKRKSPFATAAIVMCPEGRPGYGRRGTMSSILSPDRRKPR